MRLEPKSAMIQKVGSLSPLTTRAKRYVVTIVLLGLVVHFVLPQIASLEHSLQVLRGMTWWAVALAVLAQGLSYLSSGFLLQSIANVIEPRVGLGRATLMAMASASLGLVAGGMVGTAAATYRWLCDAQVNPESAALEGWLPI